MLDKNTQSKLKELEELAKPLQRFVIEYPVPTILMFVSAVILGITKEI